jgi:hypothetical protein
LVFKTVLIRTLYCVLDSEREKGGGGRVFFGKNGCGVLLEKWRVLERVPFILTHWEYSLGWLSTFIGEFLLVTK